MPGYPFLAKTPLDADKIDQDMKVLAIEGVPYTDEMIAKAAIDLRAQATDDDPNAADLVKRYPKANARAFGEQKGVVTEADALIAYLQSLGTAVDFKIYDDKANMR
jgi:cytochrome c oxidase cbb3-type subunit 2